MEHNKQSWVVLISVFVALEVLSHGNSEASDTPSSGAGVSLSTSTQALNDLMRHQDDGARAALEANLGDMVKQTVVAANKGDGKYVVSVLTQQYRGVAEKLVKAFAPGTTVDQQIVQDFCTYSILKIDRVIVEKDVAFVQAKIQYHPDAIAGIVKDEREAMSDGGEDENNLWRSMGGDASANRCEKNGIGLATYYLVVQQAKWKLHSTYFSLNPLSLSDLQTINNKMITLVQ